VSNTASSRSEASRKKRKIKRRKEKEQQKRWGGNAMDEDGKRGERRDQKIKKRRIGLRLGPIRQLRSHWTTPNLFLST